LRGRKEEKKKGREMGKEKKASPNTKRIELTSTGFKARNSIHSSIHDRSHRSKAGLPYSQIQLFDREMEMVFSHAGLLKLLSVLEAAERVSYWRPEQRFLFSIQESFDDIGMEYARTWEQQSAENEGSRQTSYTRTVAHDESYGPRAIGV